MQLSWFRKPTEDEAGTTNLCYQALDLQIIRGHASDPAARRAGESVDFGTLLERVAALGGVLNAVGVEKGDRTGVLLDDPLDGLVASLASMRAGAVLLMLTESSATPMIDAHTPAVVLTSRTLHYAAHTPAAVVLRGPEPEDPRRDLDWEVAARAGRTDPAGAEPVRGDSVAYVHEHEVKIVQVPSDSSTLARQLATLTAGGCVDLDKAPMV